MSPPTARAAAAAAAIVVGLIASWFVPILAVVVVWPLLFIVPGWAVMAWTRPRIDAAGRLGLAVVLSVVLSTHLVHAVALLAGGYDRWVVFAVAALLALAIPVAIWRGDPAPAPAAFRGARPALVVAALAALVVGGTLAVGIWRVGPEGVTSGGSNWSDLGVHLSIAQSLNAGGNFPPDVPYFAGAPLVYHWFADLHAAMTAEAAGLFAIPAMVVQSTVLSAALALLVFSLARRLLRGANARRTAAIAAGLAVFAGGLGWIRLIGDMTVDPAAANAPTAAGDLVRLIATNSYDNQWLTGWPYFRIPSVMGTGLLAHRATTVGLPIFVGAILLLVAGLPSARARAAGWRDNRALIGLAGLLGALLAPFHFFLFPALPLLALAWVVASGRFRDRDALRNAAWFLAPYLLALPFVIAPLAQASGSGALRPVLGWPSAPLSDGGAAVLFFYVTNLGVPFLLALAALYVPHLPHRAFLAAWVIGLFLVPNIVVASQVDFDMNKYFQAMWIGVAILAAWLIRRWRWPAVAAVFLLSVPSPLLVAGWTATSHLQVLSRHELQAAEWVAANTPPGSVFVTDGYVNSLTDAAGRLRLTTFGPYIANLGYEPDLRIGQVHRIYCDGDPALSVELMGELGADYLIDGARPSDCTTPTDFAAAEGLTLAFENPQLRIWRLDAAPSGG